MRSEPAGSAAANVASIPAATMQAGARDYRLDFFRGIALFFIFFDHIPNNPVSYVTLKTFALSDAAEVFIFISGYTAALVYGRAMLREGPVLASARIFRRAWQIYVAHLCVFMVYMAEIAYTVRRFNNPLFIDDLGVGDFLTSPDLTIIRVLLLQYQPTFLDILPLYIVLLLVFPFVVLAMRWHNWSVLIPSILLYIATQIWDFNVPGNDDEGWYFNPFAWQLLFVIAAIFGFAAGQGRQLIKPHRWLVWCAAIIVAAGAAIALSWTLRDVIPGFPTLMRGMWPLDKSTLHPLRLINMLAIVVLVARFLPRDARFLRSRPATLINLCGAHSLDVFCLSILLAVLASAVIAHSGRSFLIFLAVNLAGVMLMLVLALLLTWFNSGGKLPMLRAAPDKSNARKSAPRMRDQ